MRPIRLLSPPMILVSTLALLGLGATGLCCGATSPAAGEDFFVDPVLGSASGDGSVDNPWRTLQEVVEDGLIETRHWESLPYQPGLALIPVNPGAPVQPGDTLWLRNGFHGTLSLQGAYNAAPITIAAVPGHHPQLDRVLLSAAQHWILRGLSISPSHAPGPLSQETLFFVENHGFHGPSWDITLDDSDLFSINDASNWGASEWIDLASSGLRIDGDRVEVRNCRIRNVRFGISVGGEDARIRSNTIDGFSADGLRGLGDGGWFEYNIVKNSFVGQPEDPNHDDGFQSWSVGSGGVGTGEVRDVVLRGNIFINNEDPDHPLFSTLQGIGCFDGLFVDWTVENNLVIVDHWHGISLYGMIGGSIINNTVVDNRPGSPGPPWIRTTDHQGIPSQDVVIRNNLATDYSFSGTGIVDDHNIEVTDLEAYFVAPPFDLHLRAEAPAIDTGSSLQAPPYDAERIPRPQGDAIDIGALEWCPGCLFFGDFELGDSSDWSSSTGN
ncbi:MAG: right-handed parallel beta-helix repeat-containing protein [Thermoanaerobaculia bacterium]|nr:right-handed parallel beta-helix repeat-containing protein [Thermoanaerobaculia bacterium]